MHVQQAAFLQCTAETKSAQQMLLGTFGFIGSAPRFSLDALRRGTAWRCRRPAAAGTGRAVDAGWSRSGPAGFDAGLYSRSAGRDVQWSGRDEIEA